MPKVGDKVRYVADDGVVCDAEVIEAKGDVLTLRYADWRGRELTAVDVRPMAWHTYKGRYIV